MGQVWRHYDHDTAGRRRRGGRGVRLVSERELARGRTRELEKSVRLRDSEAERDNTVE